MQTLSNDAIVLDSDLISTRNIIKNKLDKFIVGSISMPKIETSLNNDEKLKKDLIVFSSEYYY